MALVVGGTTVTGTQKLDATTLTGNLPAISGASLTGISTTVSSQIFRLTTTFAGAAHPVIDDNWEEVDDGGNGYGQVGSYVSQSSGKFKFSTTGFYRIEFILVVQGSEDNRTGYQYIMTSGNDGTGYANAAQAGGFIQPTASSSSRFTSYCTHQMDITDTTNQAVAFAVTHQGNASDQDTQGHTDNTFTSAVFTRLGDT